MRILPILAGLLIGGCGADSPPDDVPEAAVGGAPAARSERPVPPGDPASAIRPEPVPAGSGWPSAPVCASVPDGTVFLVWESRREGREADIQFNRQEPGAGGDWLPEPLRLDTDSPGAARSLEPRIAVGAGGTIHVAWQDARDGEDDIRVRRSTDGGRSWAPEIRVDGDPRGASVSSMPALAADARDHVYVAWEDQRNGDRDIYLARSTDGGRTFQPDVRLDADEPGAGVSYHPDLLCWDDGSVFAFWRDERDGLADVYLRRSRDSGKSWDPEERLDSGEPGSTASMHLGVAGRGIDNQGTPFWAAVWAEGDEVVGWMEGGAIYEGPYPVLGRQGYVAMNWRHSLLPEDDLVADAAFRGVIPAAALAGSHVLWAGLSTARLWYAVPTDTGIDVTARRNPARGPSATYRVILEPDGMIAGRRPTSFTGARLPDRRLFLAWVRESDAGPRLESVILREPR